MAATEQSTVYESRGYKPNFIRGIVRNPMRNVSNTAAAPQFSNIQDTILHDHRLIRSLAEAITTNPNVDDQTRYQNQLTWELARHLVGTEIVLFPAYEKYIRHGGEIAESERKVHESLKRQLKTFQDLKVTDQGRLGEEKEGEGEEGRPSFREVLDHLMEVFVHRLAEPVDSDYMPKLRSLINEQESQALSQQFDRAKLFVPSRAHPGSPSKPPFETAYALLTAPADRLRDVFRKWPDEWSKAK